MKVQLDEAPDGSQKTVDGHLFVLCDCGYNDPCPQGKPAGSDRCTIRIEVRRLKKREVKRLLDAGR
jgi:hypothetical protein